jgi:hypothetical protein
MLYCSIFATDVPFVLQDLGIHLASEPSHGLFHPPFPNGLHILLSALWGRRRSPGTILINNGFLFRV